jgi:NitT/TauT family transport system substrate-binding protein
MLPEPFVSIAESRSENIRTVLDLNREWARATGSDLAMSALIAQRSFVNERKADVEALLLDYKESVDFVNGSPEAANLVAEKGFIPDAEIAGKAIPGCNLVLPAEKADRVSLLKAFYEILFEMEPKSIGGALPDEDFYY